MFVDMYFIIEETHVYDASIIHYQNIGHMLNE